MKSGIYTITNLVNNKIYVGESKFLKRRLSEHKRDLENNIHKNSYLQRAVNKYGMRNFLFEELELCEEKFLNSLENYWCNLLNTHNRKYGYNLRQTGKGNKSLHSLETREKISKSAKEREPSSIETRLKIGLKNKGQKRDLAFRNTLKETRKGKDNPFYGKTHSNEHKNTLRELRARKVVKICKSNKSVLFFDSILEASLNSHFSSSGIGHHCTNRIISRKDILWMYIEDFQSYKNVEEIISTRFI